MSEDTQPQETASNVNFAEQMRSERISIIWKITLAICVVLAWAFLLVGGYADFESATQVSLIPMGIIILTSVACWWFIRNNQIDRATWAYAIGTLSAIAMILSGGDETVRQVVPFTTLIILFIVGLMLPLQNTIWLVPLNMAVIFGAPWVADGQISSPTEGMWLAFFLTMVTILVTAQASGELFAIADWALENYRRERTVANRLYENRQELEKSLVRQRGLTTEVKIANEELAIAQKQAEEAKHFRGQFLANMSHELRTPLNAIIGFSETMLNFPMMYNMVELPPEYHGDLEQIHNSGKHLLNIINDILDLSKIDAGRLEVELVKVDLEPIIKGVMSIAVGLVGGKPIKLTRDTPEVIPPIKGDPVRVRQVLLNIYSNAAKFTEEGSIKLTLTHDSDMVTLGVHDTGEGIHPKDMSGIFEEFRQGSAGRKKARAGSGLGLPITRQLLNLMGGEVWAESVYGEGTTFYFTFPLYKEDPKTEANSEEALVAPATS